MIETSLVSALKVPEHQGNDASPLRDAAQMLESSFLAEMLKAAGLGEQTQGWGGGIGLSKNLEGIQLDAAYEYMNWMLEGWVGAFLGRQGYYSAAPENAKQYMSEAEWSYWYEGEPAGEDMVDPFGKTLAKAGSVRDGGSFKERFGNIVCWNSTMEENTYLVQKWNEFIAS